MEAQRHVAHSHLRRAAQIAPRESPRLELEGELVFTAENGHRIELSAAGSEVRLEVGEVPRRRATLRLLRSSLTLARRLSNALHNRSLRLVITRQGEPLIALGSGISGGPLARLCGVSRVRFYRRRPSSAHQRDVG